MSSKSKVWIVGYLILVIGALTVVGQRVVKVDPFFHYHAPYTNAYYYDLDNERSQNDGIVKNFEYDALITGTSMTQNFKTSEMDEIFGTNSIKVPFPGGSYKEVNDNIKTALSHNPNLKIIVRGLDMGKFFDLSSKMRFDLGQYPTYLYDDNIFNDVYYVFNRDVVFKRVYPMVIANDTDNFTPGIRSFDSYGNWMSVYTFGINSVCPEGISSSVAGEANHLSDASKAIISENIYQNVTSLAEEYPDVTFYYFFTPYSALWWQVLVNNGDIYKYIEAEQYIIEAILQADNIKLYSFNNRTDITTDLNNYKDTMHYGSWINSLMLRLMHDEQCLLTWDNYEEYIKEELSFYTSYDYSQLASQIDYGNDYFAEALLNEEINGVASIKYAEEMPAANVELSVDDMSDFKYFVFYGRKNDDNGQLRACIYDENGTKLTELTVNYDDTDNEWHQYMIDVSRIEGPVTIILDGGSSYTFGDMALY